MSLAHCILLLLLALAVSKVTGDDFTQKFQTNKLLWELVEKDGWQWHDYEYAATNKRGAHIDATTLDHRASEFLPCLTRFAKILLKGFEWKHVEIQIMKYGNKLYFADNKDNDIGYIKSTWEDLTKKNGWCAPVKDYIKSPDTDLVQYKHRSQSDIHAEQKLMRRLKTLAPNGAEGVVIAGAKPPCGGCAAFAKYEMQKYGLVLLPAGKNTFRSSLLGHPRTRTADELADASTATWPPAGGGGGGGVDHNVDEEEEEEDEDGGDEGEEETKIDGGLGRALRHDDDHHHLLGRQRVEEHAHRHRRRRSSSLGRHQDKDDDDDTAVPGSSCNWLFALLVAVVGFAVIFR